MPRSVITAERCDVGGAKEREKHFIGQVTNRKRPSQDEALPGAAGAAGGRCPL